MMKMKLLTFTAIVAGILTIGSAANAATCEGGTLATGENGHEYCRSNLRMNWWSAYAWCEANGRHMASMYEICPDWDGSTGENKCTNYNSQLKSGLWTSTPYQADKAFKITEWRKSVGLDNRTDSSNYYALCY